MQLPAHITFTESGMYYDSIRQKTVHPDNIQRYISRTENGGLKGYTGVQPKPKRQRQVYVRSAPEKANERLILREAERMRKAEQTEKKEQERFLKSEVRKAQRLERQKQFEQSRIEKELRRAEQQQKRKEAQILSRHKANLKKQANKSLLSVQKTDLTATHESQTHQHCGLVMEQYGKMHVCSKCGFYILPESTVLVKDVTTEWYAKRQLNK